MAAAEVKAALQRREPFTLSLAEIGAQDLLTILAEDGASYHVRVESETAWVDVEIGNGIVMGARAASLEGRPAYLMIRKITCGIALIRPKRFLSLANVLEPIGALPDLSSISIAPPPNSDPDTIELSVPEARPSHVPITLDPTDEVDALLPALPPPPLVPPPVRKSSPARAKRRPRRTLAFAGIALGVWGMAAGVIAAFVVAQRAAPARAEPIVAGALAIAVVETAEPAPAVEEAPVVVERAPARADARTLAREARMMLRQGRSRAALRRAREALRLRPGAPFYQTLVGDALAANGEDEEARRMWRRAHRGRRS